ncbi:unnamed protein product [Adineta steineri]|uniref:Uncharacterized protein n=1 Tax=Adineta steineri TaxID=433720 RepID=A0A815RWU5_9BILA|nr:unnamed protein product [Adineta steineri]CAF3554861.1 unnamed protein product [Adineta steineri]
METFSDTPNSEKHSLKLHVHIRRSSAYPSHNNISSARIMAAGIRRQSTSIFGYKYVANRAKLFSSSLAEHIYNEIKQLAFARYKTIVQVIIGLKRSEGLFVTSRCFWDVQLDRQLIISKQTATAFITVTIFLVYILNDINECYYFEKEKKYFED